MADTVKLSNDVPEAAIRSSIEFARRTANNEKYCEAVPECAHCNLGFLATWAENLLREHLQHAQQPKTPDERVKVERVGASENVVVMLDGEVVHTFVGADDAIKRAEGYRLCLIFGLKAEDKRP